MKTCTVLFGRSKYRYTYFRIRWSPFWLAAGETLEATLGSSSCS